MNKKHFFCAVTLCFLLFAAQTVTAKMWLTPEVVDDSESADFIGNISASVSRFNNLYLTWENVINEDAAHSTNLFGKVRFPSLNWADTQQLTHHIFDVGRGAGYPYMDTNSGQFSGDNVYLTYSSAREGYIHRNMTTGATTIIDVGTSGNLGNGAVFVAEEPLDFHVLYLKSPERQLSYKKYNEMPAELGWTAPTLLSDAGRIILRYDMDVDSDRTIHVVWSESIVGDFSRTTLNYLKHTEADGWDTEPTVLSTAATITGVKIRADYEGNLHVVWRDMDVSDHPTEDIFYKTYRADRWGPDVNLSNGDEHVHNPSLVITTDNKVHVAWIGTGLRIVYRQWDSSWQPLEHLTEGDSMHSFMTSDRSNNLYIFYSADNPSPSASRQLNLIRYADPSIYTPEGTDVRVELDGHSVSFDEVTESGATTIISRSEGSELPADYSLACIPPQYFNITSTARFSGAIEICIAYDDSTCSEDDLQLLHNLGDEWEDITTSIDTENNIICGRMPFGSFSEFALTRPAGSVAWSSYAISALAAVLVLAFVALLVLVIKKKVDC